MDKRITEAERLPLLDALRTLAAFGVMFYHTPQLFALPGLFSRTYLFVDLFFLLSGFVLTLSAEPRLKHGLSTAEFLRARAIRLWPVMALGALAGAAVIATQESSIQVVWLLALSLLMIPLTSGHTAIFPLNGPQWSLLWEFAANLVHGAVLKRLGDGRLLILAGACGMALVAVTFSQGCNCVGPNVEQWWLAAPRIAWSYVLGMWMARRWIARRPEPILPWWAALLLPLAALVLLPRLGLGMALGDALAVIVVLPATFWTCAAARPPRRLSGFLGRAGSLSFPIYALHFPTLLLFHFMLGKGWQADFLGVATCLLLAAAVAAIGPRLRTAFLRPGTRSLSGKAPRDAHAA